MRTPTGKKKSVRCGVLVCGAYGHGNAGDDAILEAIIREMRGLDPDMPLTVLSKRPKQTSAKYGVRAIHTFNFFRFLPVMAGVKLYINGGGSLIQDVTSRRSLWYYLFTIAAAKILGSRVIMYGCGIGPVTRSYNRRLTERIVNRYVDIITLREDDSLAELNAYGVTKPEIILSSDPALSLISAPTAEVNEKLLEFGINPDGKYVCFALRRWKGFEKKALIFAQAANYAYEKYGLTPVFLSINHRNDGDAADIAVTGLTGPYYILREPMETSVTIGVLSRMEIVVAMRLHGLVFAAGQGVPLVGVAYDPKVTAFLKYMGLDLYTQFEDLNAQELKKLVDKAEEMTRNKKTLAAKAARLAEIEERNVKAAKRLIEA